MPRKKFEGGQDQDKEGGGSEGREFQDISVADNAKILAARAGGSDPYVYFVFERSQKIGEVAQLKAEIEESLKGNGLQTVDGRLSDIEQIDIKAAREKAAREKGLAERRLAVEREIDALDNLLIAMREGRTAPVRQEFERRAEESRREFDAINEVIEKKLSELISRVPEGIRGFVSECASRSIDLRSAAEGALTLKESELHSRAAMIYEKELKQIDGSLEVLFDRRAGLCGRRARLMMRASYLPLYEKYGAKLAV